MLKTSLYMGSRINISPIYRSNSSKTKLKHIPHSRASLSGIEVIFKPEFMYKPSWPGVFQFSTFFSAALSDFKWIIAWTTSSNLWNSLLLLLLKYMKEDSSQKYCYYNYNLNLNILSLSKLKKMNENNTEKYCYKYFNPLRVSSFLLFSLESEWQQISQSLQDSSQYSGWS